MGEVQEGGPRKTGDKWLNGTSLLLLLAVIVGSPVGFATALMLAFEDVGGYVFLFLPIALQMLYLMSIYLLGSARPRPDRNLPRAIRLAVFAIYLASVFFMAWWLYDGAQDQPDAEEVLHDIATSTFLFVLPVHSVIVLLLTGLSSTFREKGSAFRLDLILAVLASAMPYANFFMFALLD